MITSKRKPFGRMVAWCCSVIFPITGIALLLSGILLQQENANDPSFQSMIIGGAVLLGLALLNFFAYWFIKYKVANVRKGGVFPEKRNTVFSFLVGIYAAFMTLFVAWPLGWLIQTITFYVVTPFVSERVRLKVVSFVSVSSQQLFTVWLSPFWHVNIVRRPEGGVPSRSILMPNHLSFSDGFVISSALWPHDAKFAATAWLFKLPFGGWMFRRAGNLMIKLDRVDPETNKGRRFRPDKEVAERSMALAKKYVTEGTRVGVFPEGGISPDGGYTFKPFQNGFFRLAVETGTPIVPVAMWGNQTMWIHEAPAPQIGYAEIALGDPIPVEVGEDLEALKERVRNAMTELLHDMPLYKRTQNYEGRITGKMPEQDV